MLVLLYNVIVVVMSLVKAVGIIGIVIFFLRYMLVLLCKFIVIVLSLVKEVGIIVIILFFCYFVKV